jgi:tetratricopeptide (TPR) repeat protein
MRFRLIFDQDRGKGIRHHHWARSTILASGLAMSAVLASGCLLTPRRPTPAVVPTPPATASQGVPGPIPADRGQLVDEANTFHQSATDRQRFQVHLDFGRIFEAQGNFESAILEYQDALTVVEDKERGPFKPVDRALAHRRMAATLDRLGRFVQAEVHYQKALKLSPKDPKLWNDAGYSYYLQGRWVEAEHALKTALKLAPDDPRSRTNLGLTLAAAGRSQEALQLLSRNEGDAIGHANLGYLLAATGQVELARHHYQTALAMRPDLTLARRALTQLERQQPDASKPETTPTLMAQVARSTPASVDPPLIRASTTRSTIPRPSTSTMARSVKPGLTQESTLRTKSSPPLPTRVLPNASAAGSVDSRVNQASQSRIKIPPPRNFAELNRAP